MMGNSNSLPVALIHSLSRDSGSRLVMDPLGDAAHVARRGIAFVLFYSLFSNILRWTVCYQLMARDPADELPTIQYDGTAAHEAITVPGYELPPPKAEDMFPGDALVADVPCADRNTYRNKCRRRSILFLGSQDGSESGDAVSVSSPRSLASASPSPRTSERTPLLLPDHHQQEPLPAGLLPVLEPAALPPPRLSRAERWEHFRATALEIMNAPLYAAILALFIGLIPPLKGLFFSSGGNEGGHALLEEIVTDPLYSLGEASVPIIILTLGGQLGSMGKRGEGSGEGSTAGAPTTDALDISIVIFVRMLLIPAISGPILWGMASHVPLVGDKTFVTAMMLLAACPPALNLMNMSQAQRNHENITARLLSWAYLVSIPLLTGWVVLTLLLLETSWPSKT
ncbi:hypothetical protein HDU86_000950 [Geranomyces michiganensis]|nr:hypothetical protein HDU86_000950 [Geranomyces michiganensis]